MSGIVQTVTYGSPPVRKKEILRYAGVKSDVPELNGLLDDCLAESAGKLTYKACYCEFDLSVIDGGLDLGFAATRSAQLQKNLDGCDSAVVFAATVGVGIDRLIARYNTVSPAKALMFQAIGAERIESLCDLLNGEIRDRAAACGKFVRPRFSPGYGDLPLELQKDIFRVLDCPRKIGVTLNDSLLMSPSKSVTAIIGVGTRGKEREHVGCRACAKQDCAFRK